LNDRNVGRLHSMREVQPESMGQSRFELLTSSLSVRPKHRR